MASTDSSSNRTEIVLVDDHPATRDGMKGVLETTMGLSVVAEADDGSTGIDMIEQHDPDLAVIDLALPGGHGFDLLRTIRPQHPDTKLVVYSMFDENVYAERAFRAGARGYVMKEAPVERLVEAIREVAAGRLYLSPEMKSKSFMGLVNDTSEGASLSIAQLSDRELQVFQLLGECCTADEIADYLNLARKTIEAHRRHAKEKLGCKTTAELTARAIQWQLTQPHSDDNPSTNAGSSSTS